MYSSRRVCIQGVCLCGGLPTGGSASGIGQPCPQGLHRRGGLSTPSLAVDTSPSRRSLRHFPQKCSSASACDNITHCANSPCVRRRTLVDTFVFNRLQGMVVFLEASVSHSVQGMGARGGLAFCDTCVRIIR